MRELFTSYLLYIFDRLVEEPDLFAIGYCQCVYFASDDGMDYQRFSQV